ncbi:MAG: hypothetical protein RSE95_03160 [Malacoplasma sp.]
MKNKIFNSFLLVGNVIYTIGLVLTSVLIIRSNKSSDIQNVNVTLLFLPSIICTFLSIILFCLYFYNKRIHFILIKMHINSKWIFLHYLSGLLLCFGILITAILMWTSNLVSMEMQNQWYFYFVIGLNILFLMISYGIDAYSNFRVSIDIARRKMGDEFEKNYIDSKKNQLEDFNLISDDDITDNKNQTDDFINFKNKDIDKDAKKDN